MSAGSLLIALALDRLFGWPDRLYRCIGHPVSWLGHSIAYLERSLNPRSLSAKAKGRCGGLLTLALVAGLSGLAGALLQQLFSSSAWHWLLLALIAWPLLAMRSLAEHVQAVATPLLEGDLPGARTAVSMIVGRNPAALDAAGVARAALESLAENTSDGVIAPLFWAWLFGLPGLFVYKSVNTLDSMIAHHDERHEHFGWASAHLDDLMNLIPARLTGLLFALQGPWHHQRLASIIQAMRNEAPRHRSPNAGWPESALANTLGVRLAGPRQYGETQVDEPFFNAEGRDPKAEDIERGLSAYRWLMRSVAGMLLTIASLSSATHLF